MSIALLVPACATARVSWHLTPGDRAPGMWVCSLPSRAGALAGIRASGHGGGRGPCGWCSGCLALNFCAGHGRTQPPSAARNMGHRGRPGLGPAGQMGACPGRIRTQAHAHAQAWPAEPATKHQPHIRLCAACAAVLAQRPATMHRRRHQQPAKPGQRMSTHKTPATAGQQHGRRRHHHMQGEYARETERFVSSEFCVCRHR